MRLLFAGAAALLAACATSIQSAPDALPDPLAAGWAGRAVCERLAEDQKQRILRCTFPPGVGHERHFHVAHVGYCLSGGTMEIIDATGRREVTVSTGSHYHSSGTDWHEVRNIGDTTVTYLIIESK